ncbi:FAD-dependent oxidoreductase [Bacillus shivajii]|uniref:FAD-dependent oxidoreductase n=1 Tax=Bacillus shivajii TaxID=1983719 RepID=UPI001CFA3290|nr:FAD-dependent oxidoreductase [Bacillus shivajii]UCZ55416.1 FAD-dependent oxidoreductase [Bacillus shivajii]
MSGPFGGLPQYPESYWLDSVKIPSFEKMKDNIESDVLIVGGGITGITTAYLLSKEGVKVTLIDATTLFNGTTGHTTAKITSQHDLIYDELIHHFGENFAKTYYETTTHAKSFIKETIDRYDIDCGYEEKDAVLYATTDQYKRKLEKEYKAYRKLGIPAEELDSLPFPVEITKAIAMKDQAQFHPLKYLTRLVEEFIANGGEIYEQTTAVEIMGESATGQHLSVETRDGHHITCSFVVQCTHFPFFDHEGGYFARLKADRSYIVAAKGNVDDLPGMYLSVDEPKRSVRTVQINGETHLLLSGENHKTGQGISTIKHYEALQQYGMDIFDINEIPYRWSAQDLTTLDNVPYVGPVSNDHSNIFVATGFRKWGMTHGTAAAHVLKDSVLQKDTPAMELYSPERFHADPSIKHFIQQGWDVTKQFTKGKLMPIKKKIDDVEKGEGAVVDFNGNRFGCYRDDDGEVHLVDTTCKHMGCEVEWNSGDNTWDCPCHGSRYSFDGEVIEGPAKEGLRKGEE